MTYRLAVGAMFKDEGHALVEWVEHYLLHGVEHFYLIDDASRDNGSERLKPYIDRGLVSLVIEQPPVTKHGRMQMMYDKHVLPHLRETEWMLICDLDEFIWSPKSTDLPSVLYEYRSLPAVWFRNTRFGSNGHDAYPARGIVASYTRRETASPSTELQLWKYFVNSKADVRGLFIHWPILGHGQKQVNGEESFVFNHYCCQCAQWWREVKATRGVSDMIGRGSNYPNDGKRDMGEFMYYDRNEVEDLRLYEQNKELIDRLYPQC